MGIEMKRYKKWAPDELAEVNRLRGTLTAAALAVRYKTTIQSIKAVWRRYNVLVAYSQGRRGR